MNRLLCVFISLLFMGCNSVFAGEVELEKIVVTASRMLQQDSSVNQKVDVVEDSLIESRQANNLAKAIESLTPVQVINYGGLGASKSVRMRGASPSQVLVMVDGRPINNARDGQAELNSIQLDNIGRIELLRGAASSLYGSSAMGGVINLISRPVPKKGFHSEIHSGFGTFRRYSERLLHEGRPIPQIGYSINYSYNHSQGHRSNSDFEANNFNAKISCEPTDQNRFEFLGGAYKDEAGTPGPASFPDEDDRQKSRKNYYDIIWEFDTDEKTQVKLRTYQNYDRLEFIENTPGDLWSTPFAKDIHATRQRGLDFTASRAFCENFSAVGGFNYVDNKNDSTTSAKHKYIVKSWYFTGKLKPLPGLDLDFGSRVDDYSNFGSQVSPNIGIGCDLRKGLKFYALTSRSFRAPTFNDLYWPDEGWAKGNPSLKPEKGINGEAGFRLDLDKHIRANLCYFRSRYSQLINWVPDASGWVWSPTNIGKALIDGIESDLSVMLTEDVGLSFGYTYVRAKDSDTRKFLIYQPKHKAKFGLKHSDIYGFSVELKGEFTGKAFHDSQNATFIERYYLLGFNIDRKINQHAHFYLSVDNLLNKKYAIVQDYPMPGFSVNACLKLEF